MFGKMLEDMNFLAGCRKYNIGVWQCPNFLFLLMGIVAITAMTVTYFISNRYFDESVTIVSATIVTALILTIGHFVVRGVEQIAIANVIKTEFISILTHQLGGPLAAIKWNLEVLDGELRSTGCLREKNEIFFSNVKESSDKMLKLVSYLTEVTRIEQGSAIFEEENIDVAQVVRETLKNLEKLATARKIKIILKGNAKLPAVVGDRKKMLVVFDNLIGNAIKYSNEGSKVEITLRNKNGKIEAMIRDWGVGIPDYQRSRIFEKFFRSNNTSKYRTEGVGIGLFLVKAILKHLGGAVWFESEEGKGSTFYVNIPVSGNKS